jgi:hypothetical protein
MAGAASLFPASFPSRDQLEAYITLNALPE